MIDPFLGIGSSALAALECEIREFIGFEIDSDYLNTAKEQVAAARAAMIEPPRKKEATRKRGISNSRAMHETVKA